MSVPVDENDIVYRLRKRAEIRRQITTRKSVQEGQADRLADLLDEAAGEIEKLREAQIAPRQPSAQMLFVLQIAAQGGDIRYVRLVDGKGSQSRTVGRGLTIEACQRHGWLDRAGALTDAGRRMVQAAERRRQIRLGLA